MWIPSKLLSFITSADSNAQTLHEAIVYLREELASVRAERDALSTQLTVSQTHFDWMRMRTNQLEHTNALLLTKATGISIAAPEIARQRVEPELTNQSFSFEDVGDDLAKKYGLTN